VVQNLCNGPWIFITKTSLLFALYSREQQVTTIVLSSEDRLDSMNAELKCGSPAPEYSPGDL
jgi:hypothetical protein